MVLKLFNRYFMYGPKENLNEGVGWDEVTRGEVIQSSVLEGQHTPGL